MSLLTCVIRIRPGKWSQIVRRHSTRVGDKKFDASILSDIKPLPQSKGGSIRATSKNFVDLKYVTCIGGNGGNGCIAFSSYPGKEWAGPDGGDGGNGGHVIVKVDHNVKSLGHLSSIIKSEQGVNGGSKCCHGKNADHTVVPIPIGTIVKDDNNNVIIDLETEGSLYVAARGGAGGKGNNFYLSNENRAPDVAETGGHGENRRLVLELKTIAHAGLVGFPNAGKSTLLRAITRARPKVAAYPFTTLKPHVGIVEYEDYEQVMVADIPGIIEGAHKNRGLGISFLKHIERCICLLFVIDLSISDPHKQLDKLKHELEQYETGLSKRPHAIIGNKIDIPWAKENLTVLEKHVDMPVFPVSAKKLMYTETLLLHLRKLYDNYQDSKAEKAE